MRLHSRIISSIAFVIPGMLITGCNSGRVAPSPSPQPQATSAATPPETLRKKQLFCPAPPNSPRTQQSVGHHKVILSWNASAPTPTADGDPVQGYCVYRSTKRKAHFNERELVNAKPFAGTGCVDDGADDGKIYYYAVTTISAKGLTSLFSKEARAEIPATKRSSSVPATSYPLCRENRPPSN